MAKGQMVNKGFLVPPSTALVFSLLLVSCGGGADSEPQGGENIARAQLIGADQASYGEAIIAEGDNGLLLRVDAEGMTPGTHGVHIHMVGKCEGPDFKSAGGHWNPLEKQHGFDNPAGAHMGDIVNLEVGSDGKGSLESVVEGATLKSGDSPMLDDDGAAFVVHAAADDFVTDPSGDSGGRIACGVFALQNYVPAQ